MNGRAEPELVLVLAPIGRDGPLACEVLARFGVTARPVTSMAELVGAMNDAGAAIIAGEALDADARALLVGALARQEAWSDFPLLVFTQLARDDAGDEVRQLGNATLLERPLGVQVLVSAVRSALRARRRQYEARRAIQRRDEFLAMLGHELRNPLGAIALAVGVGDPEGNPERMRRNLPVLKRQVENLSRLVDDLLDVARVTNGRIELVKQPLDLAEVAARCVQAALPAAERNGLALAIEVDDGDDAIILADTLRIEQVLNNLITNALKYTPRGGHVRVRVEHDDAWVRVHVKDDGVGVTPEMLPNIFELFTQAPSTLARSHGGLGIGLTLVRSLVHLHGGTVEAFSEGRDRGTEVVVSLPRTSERAPRDISAEAPAVGGGERRACHVVIVDDSEDGRELLKALLEESGHHVVTAGDGGSGLRSILEVVPDLAVIDIGLPGIDGYEVARQAREALGARVRLVALTGYGQPADRERALQAGFDVHMTKPVDVDALRALFPA